MVVHDRSYARWDGDRSGRVRAASVIALAGIRQGSARIFRNKLVAVVLVLPALGPFTAGLLVMVAASYLRANAALYPDLAGALDDPAVAALLTLQPETIFSYWARLQVMFVLIACVLVGSGLIAGDRRANALELYFSRPVGIVQYVLGKFLAVAFFVAIVTVVPAAIAVLVQLSLSFGEAGETARLAGLLGRTLAAGAVWVVVPSLLVLAASALARTARAAAVAWLAFVLLLEGPVSNILVEQLDEPAFLLLSFRHNIWQTTAALLGDTNPRDVVASMPAWQSAAVLAGWAVLCLALIRWRVRPVEIVA